MCISSNLLATLQTLCPDSQSSSQYLEYTQILRLIALRYLSTISLAVEKKKTPQECFYLLGMRSNLEWSAVYSLACEFSCQKYHTRLDSQEREMVPLAACTRCMNPLGYMVPMAPEPTNLQC